METIRYKFLYYDDQIQSRVERVAANVRIWCEEVIDNTDQQPIVVCLLRGGVHFYSDLTRSLHYSVEPVFVKVKNYQGQNQTLTSEIQQFLDPVIFHKRGVLIVDDICDTGRALKEVITWISLYEPYSIKTAVCINRKMEKEVIPDFVAFEHEGDEWFVGYGLDDNDLHSNMSHICIIDPIKT